MAETHTAGCYCGALEIEMRGAPLENFPAEIGGSGQTMPE